VVVTRTHEWLPCRLVEWATAPELCRRCALLHHGSDPLDLPNTSMWREAPRQLASAAQIVPSTVSVTDMRERSTVPSLALDITIPIQVVALTRQGTAIGQLQIALRPLERLDRRLFIYA